MPYAADLPAADLPAADLPAVEPTDADLIDLLTLPWEDTQGHLERLLAEAGLLELRRAVAEAHVAPVRQLPIRTAAPESTPERRAA